jgi:DNA-directed RNA polymerase subunit M/transcription elongation factor TFIIS
VNGRYDYPMKEQLTVSGVCTCSRCGEAKNIYRMIGKCLNCGTDSVLMLFRAGEKTQVLKCPVCGVGYPYEGVRAYRLATDDEIPVAPVETSPTEEL